MRMTLPQVEKMRREARVACEKHRGDGFAEMVITLADLIIEYIPPDEPEAESEPEPEPKPVKERKAK